MKNLKITALGTLFFAGTLSAEAAPKTVFPVKIDPATVDQEPYRFNGVVLTAGARGSGFCAWNKRAFFSAAHVVIDEDTKEMLKFFCFAYLRKIGKDTLPGLQLSTLKK